MKKITGRMVMKYRQKNKGGLSIKLFNWIYPFLGLSGITACSSSAGHMQKHSSPPNILIILADQWRAEAFGHRGNPDVLTPNIDRLATEGIEFTNAVSGMPVSTPARASLLTGRRPLSNGVFMNDVQLDTNAVSLAKVMQEAGYQTAYIGKWHIDGHGRSSFIPSGNRRQGFQYWKVLECTHNYNNSIYYANSPDTLLWDGYDAIAQTRDACGYIQQHSKDKDPFLLFLSWGPPHEPYQTAPGKYRQLYSPEKIHLKTNVPDSFKQKARKDIADYYSHCTALDDMIGNLRTTLKEADIDKNTIILFLSDHGDLLGSHGYYFKQQPYDESIRIPLIFYVPEKFGGKPQKKDAMISIEDIMPTILGLCSVENPAIVDGTDYSKYIKGGENPGDTVALISCVQPFGQWSREKGGREYRGLRSPRYTYVKDMKGPWLFFDNKNDSDQLNNLIDNGEYAAIIKSFDALLVKKLEKYGDRFFPGPEYVKMWNYPALDKTETVPYH